MQHDPYMPAGYPAPYPGQVFYIPSPMGVIAGGHSPNLTAMSPYAGATSPHPSTRSPTVPFTHHQTGQVAMTLSPQPSTGGFGFGSPSMAYGFGGSSASAGIPGSSPGAAGGMGEMRSPRIMSAGGGNSRGLVGSTTFGAGEIHSRSKGPSHAYPVILI